jgi:SAM-dependent methyltransferase
MDLKEIYKLEKDKWDKLAAHELSRSSWSLPDDNFQKFARRSSTMIGVTEFLGDLRGKTVLEYGCGFGEISLLLAKSGAKVTTFDLSEVSVAVTRQRSIVQEQDTKVDLAVSAGERLPYADESFDIVLGRAILHHLDVELAWKDLYRVLKFGGRGVFVEPMGMNPVLNFVRDYIPYPHKNPRGADRPLNYRQIERWGEGFSKFCFKEIQLLSMLERGLGFKKKLPVLRNIDDVLLNHLPFLRRYCRYVVLYMVR